ITAVNDIECAAASRAHAAFRISIALGSSTGAGAGSAWTDALAGFEALDAGCGCWALAIAVTSTPNVSSRAYPVGLYRFIASNSNEPNRGILLMVIISCSRSFSLLFASGFSAAEGLTLGSQE